MTQFLIAIALCYILIKIPFWMLSAVRGGGRSYVMSMVKAFVAYKTLGLAGSAMRRLSWKKPAATPEPYRATSSGQYMLPLDVTRQPRPKPKKTAPAAGVKNTGRSAGARSRQLMLPLDGEWPENKPRRGRNGQYEFPFGLQRQPRPKPAEPTDPAEENTGDGTSRGPQRSQQTRLPRTGDWPEHRPVLTSTGQYRLPIRATRTPRPEQPPAPPRRRQGPDRQQSLPLNLPKPPTRPSPPPRPRPDPVPRPDPAPQDGTPSPSPWQRGAQPSAPPPEPQRVRRPAPEQLPLNLPNVTPPPTRPQRSNQPGTQSSKQGKKGGEKR